MVITQGELSDELKNQVKDLEAQGIEYDEERMIQTREARWRRQRLFSG